MGTGRANRLTARPHQIHILLLGSPLDEERVFPVRNSSTGLGADCNVMEGARQREFLRFTSPPPNETGPTYRNRRER